MNVKRLLRYIGLAGLMGLIISSGDIKNEILGGILIIAIVVLDILESKRAPSKLDVKK
jgi:hypothetical protein